MRKTKKNTALRTLIESQLEGTKQLVYNEGTENELKVKVYIAIPFNKRTEMIMEIVSWCFAKNPVSIEDYRPMSLEFSKRYAVLSYFTDLKLPEDLNELWLVLNHTPIYDDVVNILGEQLWTIFDEAAMAIDAKVRYLTHKSDLNLFLNNISKVVESFGENLAGIDISSLARILTSLKGVSNDDIIDGILRSAKDEKTLRSPMGDNEVIIKN